MRNFTVSDLLAMLQIHARKKRGKTYFAIFNVKQTVYCSKVLPVGEVLAHLKQVLMYLLIQKVFERMEPTRSDVQAGKSVITRQLLAIFSENEEGFQEMINTAAKSGNSAEPKGRLFDQPWANGLKPMGWRDL